MFEVICSRFCLFNLTFHSADELQEWLQNISTLDISTQIFNQSFQPPREKIIDWRVYGPGFEKFVIVMSFNHQKETKIR